MTANQIAMIILSAYVLGYIYFIHGVFFATDEEGKKGIDDSMEKISNDLGPQGSGVDENTMRGLIMFLGCVIMLFWPLIIVAVIWKKITGQY